MASEMPRLKVLPAIKTERCESASSSDEEETETCDAVCDHVLGTSLKNQSAQIMETSYLCFPEPHDGSCKM